MAFVAGRLDAAAGVGELRRLPTVAVPAGVPRVVANDADNDHVLVRALAGNADLIVFSD